MCQKLLFTITLTVVLCAFNFVIVVEARVSQNSCEKPCEIQRVHRMLSADCYDRICRQFPRNLQSNIEAFDAAQNRIRKITVEDLEPYPDLKYLYLGDNMIAKIQPEALADKELIALDLSLNGFASEAAIPDVIFQLPSLKHLYLSQNHNINMVEVIENAAPIRAPLESLDISYTGLEDEEWQTLPIMGILPTLIKYNVSGMNLILNTSQFAGLCNLEIFVNANVTAMFTNPCDCWTLDTWLKERGVKFDNYTHQCVVRKTECEYEIPQEHIDLFTSCKEIHAEQIYTAKMNKTLLIVGSVFGIILMVMIVVLWKWRRTKIRHRREKRRIVNNDEIANLNRIADN